MADERPVRRVVSWVRAARARRRRQLHASPDPAGLELLGNGERGRTLFDAGDYAGAERHLLEALRESPRGPMATYLLGLSLLFQGHRWEEGRQFVDRAYSLRHWLDDQVVAPSAIDVLSRAEKEFPDWDWPKYQLARQRWRAVGLDVVAAVQHMEGVLGDSPRFVQIGANDGRSGDPLRGLVKTVGMHGVFVEPQPGPMASLRELYSGVEGLVFAEVAITEEDGPVVLVTDQERSTLGSLAPERNKLRDRSSTTRHLNVEGLTFSSLVARYQIGQFDLLQIDTEGFDYRILRQVPLDDHGVSVVNLEYNCLPIGERLAAIRLLVDHGFALSFGTMDLLAVRGNDFEEAFCISDRGPAEGP